MPQTHSHSGTLFVQSQLAPCSCQLPLASRAHQLHTATVCNAFSMLNIIYTLMDYKYKRKTWKGEMIKNVRKKGVSLLLQLMKATVLAESSFIFSLGSLCYIDLYRCESGRCCTLSFFLSNGRIVIKNSLISFYSLPYYIDDYLSFPLDIPLY